MIFAMRLKRCLQNSCFSTYPSIKILIYERHSLYHFQRNLIWLRGKVPSLASQLDENIISNFLLEVIQLNLQTQTLFLRRKSVRSL